MDCEDVMIVSMKRYMSTCLLHLISVNDTLSEPLLVAPMSKITKSLALAIHDPLDF